MKRIWTKRIRMGGIMKIVRGVSLFAIVGLVLAPGCGRNSDQTGLLWEYGRGGQGKGKGTENIFVMDKSNKTVENGISQMDVAAQTRKT